LPVVGALARCSQFAAGAAEKATGAGTRLSSYRDIRPCCRRIGQGCHQPATAKGRVRFPTDFKRTACRRGRKTRGPPSSGTSRKKRRDSQDGDCRPRMAGSRMVRKARRIGRNRGWRGSFPGFKQGAEDDTPVMPTGPMTPSIPRFNTRAPVISSLAIFSPDGKLLWRWGGFLEVCFTRIMAPTSPGAS